MRLRCVNNSIITIETPVDILVMSGEDLELGKEYVTDCTHPYKDLDGLLVYDINGYGTCLAERFEIVQ